MGRIKSPIIGRLRRGIAMFAARSAEAVRATIQRPYHSEPLQQSAQKLARTLSPEFERDSKSITQERI